MWWRQALEQLGFGSMFVLPMATYGFFFYLDRHASPAANKALSTWLNGNAGSQIDLRAGVVSVFDRVYGHPLLSIKSFLLCALYSSLATIILNIWIFLRYLPSSYNMPFFVWRFDLAILIKVIVTIISDYVALFVIRRHLTKIKANVLKNIAVATLTGIITILIVQFLNGILIVLIRATFGIDVLSSIMHEYLLAWRTIEHQQGISSAEASFIASVPAIFVMIWIPLLGVTALVTRITYSLLWSVKWAQWAIKQGNQHPLHAAGFVAAGVVFVGSVITNALQRI